MRQASLFLAMRQVVIARSVSDEAIQSGASDWIASLPLAMTRRSRDAFQHPSYGKHGHVKREAAE
jgi:hypothetical protein